MNAPNHTPPWIADVTATHIEPPRTGTGRLRAFKSWETALDHLLKGAELARSKESYIEGRRHGTRAVSISRAKDFATQEPDAARAMLERLAESDESHAHLLDGFDAWNVPNRDPWEPDEKPQKKRGKDRELPILRPEESEAIRASIDPRGITQRRNRAMLSLLEATDMRIGELLALRHDSIEEVTERISEVHIPCVDGCKTGARSVPYVTHDTDGNPTTVTQDLEAWRRDRYSGEHLFTTRTGKPVAPQAVRRALLLYAKRAGVGHVTPHMYRHTFATRLVRKGWEPDAVRKILGHRNVATTMIYFHTDTRRLHELLMRD